MKNNLQATPTEYNGILFRSKTEAIFARSWDILNESEENEYYAHYEYEPERLRMPDGYVPDFYLSIWVNSKKHIESFIIELKPSKVTDAYRQKLAERFKYYAQAIKHNPLTNGLIKIFAPTLCIFNPFEEDFININELWLNGKFQPPLLNILSSDIIQQAKQYRFDLQPSKISLQEIIEPVKIIQASSLKTVEVLPINTPKVVNKMPPVPTVDFPKNPPVVAVDPRGIPLPQHRGMVKLPSLKEIKEQVSNLPIPVPTPPPVARNLVKLPSLKDIKAQLND